MQTIEHYADEQQQQSTLVSAIDKLNDIDGRLSASVNNLLVLDSELNGPRTAVSNPYAEGEVPEASGKLGNLCRLIDSLEARVTLLNNVTESLQKSL